ncbi:MAG: hypothetical protein R3185_03225, partial [Candidatus Thermoplasmatota archaeon]|nr:hypothetical protein [Candidatus Thermoplasmatota archaeon]
MVLAVIPASGSAGWRGYYYDQNEEPNVGAGGSYDTDSSVMWQDANQEAVDKIYFDFFTVTYDGLAYIPAANTEDSSVRSYVFEQTWARLGYWRDCNFDGYIGSATTGAVQYPKQQGIEEAGNNDPDSICPPGSLYQDDLNYNEFLAIGPNARDAANGFTQREVLCPDRHSGPAGPHEGPDGEDQPSEWETPRAETDSGILDGGNNVYCDGDYRLDWVQDDYAKVWADLGLPDDPQKPTGLILPFTDGTLRDSNGAFRWVDGLVLGQISRNAFGLWPATTEKTDPADGAQCEETEDGADVGGIVANALAWGGPGTCSPIPNVRYVSTPAGQVAWPGHLVEDRSNNSEKPNEHGDPMIAPFDEAGPEGSSADQDGYTAEEDCELKSDPDTWDNNPGDGDPLAGWDSSNPTDFSAYYGPGDDGPSIDPALGNIWGRISYEIDKVYGELGFTDNPDCNQSDNWLGPWEAHAEQGQSEDLKTQNTAGFGFDTPTYFNPSHAPGGPAPDTYASTCEESWLNLDEGSLYCGGAWEGTGFIDVPNEAPDEYWTRTIRWTGYADVSFGIPDFDTAQDGGFTADPDGVFDAP